MLIGTSNPPHELPSRTIASCAMLRYLSTSIGADFALPFDRDLGHRVVPTRQRYQQIVDRFEQIARANLENPSHMADICEAIAVSQRTLMRAVRAIHGTTPSRHLHALRLSEARRALKDGASENVTQVALRFGFRELGRFAVDYRAAFGESPSDTLRHGRDCGCR